MTTLTARGKVSPKKGKRKR